jgi:DNA-binding NtrC family response regulator
MRFWLNRQRDPETPIAMITAYGSVEVAVAALKAAPTLTEALGQRKLLLEIDR